MPELPEVETLRQDLEAEVLRARLRRVEVLQTRMTRGQGAGEIKRRLEGATISSIGRRGKYLLVRTDREMTLLLHRGMSGNVLLRAPVDEPEPHLHLLLHLDDGRQLRVVDPRGFGEMRALSPSEIEARLAALGPEPFGAQFSAAYLQDRLRGRRAPIKLLLMDQRIVAGLGNIYTDECLWLAGVHPARAAGSLASADLMLLHQAIRCSLQEAIEHRGTTFDGAMTDLHGQPGDYRPKVFVAQRNHHGAFPCARCGASLERLRLSNRGSTFCPACQRAAEE